MERIARIVAARDLVALEGFCLGKTYQQVRTLAAAAGVDLDELEDLLAQI